MNYIHPTAIIGPNVILGGNNYIGPYCIIGFPAEHKAFWLPEDDIRNWPVDAMSAFDSKRSPIKTGRVIIGSNCVFTGHVTIDAGTEAETVIGNNVWMLKHSHVGHDAIIQDGCVISCGAKVGGHAIVRENVNIGLNAVIHQRCFIPQNSMIGMGAVITKKTEMHPGQKYAGNPAKWLGENIRK